MLNAKEGVSLRRRRGTKAARRRGGGSNPTLLWAFVGILALALIGALTLL